MLCQVLLVFLTTFLEIISECVIGYVPHRAPLKTIISKEPKTWMEMNDDCHAAHPGYRLLHHRYQNTSLKDNSYCNDTSLVPLGIVKINGTTFPKDQFYEETELITEAPNSTLGALNLTTGATSWLEGNETFHCALCQLQRRKKITTPLHPLADPNNTISFMYDVIVEHQGINVSGAEILLVNILANAFKISNKSVTHVFSKQKGSNSSEMHYQLNLKTEKNVNVSLLDTNKRLNEDSLITTLRALDRCEGGTTTDDIGTIHWHETRMGSLEIQLSNRSHTPASRECFWNSSQGKEIVSWTDYIYWEEKLHNCSLADEIDNIEEMYRNQDAVLAHKRRHLLEDLANTSLPSWELNHITHIVDIIYNTTSSVIPVTHYDSNIVSCLDAILIKIIYKADEQVVNANGKNIMLLGAKVKPSGPIKGITVNDMTGIQLVTKKDHGEVDESLRVHIDFPFSFHVNNLLLERMAVVVYLEDCFSTALFMNASERVCGQLIQISFITTKNDFTIVLRGDEFIDVQFKKRKHDTTATKKTHYQQKCAYWDLNTKDWSTNGCKMLQSTRNSLHVCRCTDNNIIAANGKMRFFIAELQSNENSSSPHLKLIKISTICMTIIGVVSISLTATSFKNWRRSTVHQIVLYMSASLTLNICLSFLIFVVNVDTTSSICIAFGVIRHYFYLTMFCWMAVLSSLHLINMVNVLGIDGVNFLVLKASLFAWGLPLIPVFLLLVSGREHYTPQVKDNSFCFPEGFNFQLTVHVPTAICMAYNTAVFMYILHQTSSSCAGQNQRNTAALKSSRPSVCLYIVFVVIWFVHILAEEEVISDQLFHVYWFPILTAKLLFLLSMFSVFFNRKTRGYWKKAFQKYHWLHRIWNRTYFYHILNSSMSDLNSDMIELAPYRSLEYLGGDNSSD